MKYMMEQNIEHIQKTHGSVYQGAKYVNFSLTQTTALLMNQPCT